MFNKIFAAIKTALAVALKKGTETFTAACEEQREYIAHEIARAETLERVLSMAQDAVVNNRDIVDVTTRQNIQRCKYTRRDLNERVSSFEAIGFCFDDLIEEVVDDALAADDEVVKDVARHGVNVDTFDDSSIKACRIYGCDTLYKGRPWGYGHGSTNKKWLGYYDYNPEVKHNLNDFVAYGGKAHRKMERAKSHGRKAGRAAKEALAAWNS